MTTPGPLTYPRDVMAERARFWRSNRWREALRPDSDLAQAEGLAAGTGLLTGTVARTAGARQAHAVDADCPVCGGKADIVVVDLVASSTTARCLSCSHRWTSQT